MFDPWHFLLRHLPHVSVILADLASSGNVGETDGRSITLHRGLTQRAARSTLTHELVHLVRGPAVPLPIAEAREEVAVEAASSRLLVDVVELGEALAAAEGVAHDGVAEDLHVDLTSLRARIRACTPDEIAYLNSRIERTP